MTIREIRIAVDGATGRLCRTQHLTKSLLAIRDEGGIELNDGTRIVPVPLLLGRNPEKLSALAAGMGNLDWSIDRAACFADPTIEIYFDASATAGRVERAREAIAAGKHIYLEKPIADSVGDALDLARRAAAMGLKNGTVQDKLYLPGLRKVARLKNEGFFGSICSLRLNFGWWIFDGETVAAQRPSWNYMKVKGGGLILDMFPHWRYIIEHIAGPIRSVSCQARTRVPQRWDEQGMRYDVDVEDEVLATFGIEGGALAQIDSSWATRVRRDDLFSIQIDGSNGSAVAGLHQCFTQHLSDTPKPVWSVDIFEHQDFLGQWQEVPDTEPLQNGYREGWAAFLSHVVADTDFRPTLMEGAKGVQLVEACHNSNAERRWIDLPDLSL